MLEKLGLDSQESEDIWNFCKENQKDNFIKYETFKKLFQDVSIFTKLQNEIKNI